MQRVYVFFCESRALFTESANTKKCKSNFKIRSHGTIHIYKNCFQFLVLYNERYPNNPDGINGDGVGVLVELSQLFGSIFLKGGIIFKFCVIEMRN